MCFSVRNLNTLTGTPVKRRDDPITEPADPTKTVRTPTRASRRDDPITERGDRD